MGFPTKVQLIKRKQSEQWYINFPSKELPGQVICTDPAPHSTLWFKREQTNV